MNPKSLYSLGGLGAVALAATLSWSFIDRGPAPVSLERQAAEQPPAASKREQKRLRRTAAAKYMLDRLEPPGANLFERGLTLPIEPYLEAKAFIEQSSHVYSLSSGQRLRKRGLEKANPTLANNDWENLGPGFRTAGRLREILIDPANPNIMYAAAATGGLFKSTNAGGSWSPIGDLLPILRFGSLEMDPADSQILYAGTGEVYNARQFPGNGIFKSVDAGQSWTALNSTLGGDDFVFVNKIVVSSNDSNRVYAATRTGLFRSTDGGQSWTRDFTATTDGPETPNGELTIGCTDLLQIPDGGTADLMLGVCQTLVTGQGYRGRVFRNAGAENGIGWVEVLSEPDMDRTTLAMAPSNPEVVYAAAARPDSHLHAVFRSNDAGLTWAATTRVNSLDDPASLNNILYDNVADFCDQGGPLSAGTSPQGFYDNIVAVDPADPDRVWVGGIDVMRSDDGGLSWGFVSRWDTDAEDPSYNHADAHVMTFHPDFNGTTNQILYTGNDGGVQRTTNARAAKLESIASRCDPGTPTPVVWTNLTRGLVAVQYYHGQVDPTNEAFYLGGAQDTGTSLGLSSGGIDDWREINGGDGGFVAIDPTNTNVLITSAQQGQIDKSLQGPDSSVDTQSPAITGLNDEGFPFITPFVMDPNNPLVLWVAGSTIWRTDNQAELWNQASIEGNPDELGEASAWAVSPFDSNVVLHGRSSGLVLRNTNALSATAQTQWEVFEASPGNISSIVFDPVDSQTVYATVSSLNVDHVLRSSDLGQTWAPIDRRNLASGIPDIGVNALAVDPDDNARLYAGTELGVFVSTDGGANWTAANIGMANVQVNNLDLVRRGDSKNLYAFTHGRGLFRVSLTETPLATPTPSPTQAPTPTPSSEPTPTATPSASQQPSPTPTASAAPSPSPSPTEAPTPTPTVTPSATPSATPAPTPAPRTPENSGPAVDQTVPAAALNVAFVSFEVRNDGNIGATLDQISLDLVGNNVNLNRVSRVRLFRDTNGNGQIDTGEPQVAELAAPPADGLLDIALTTGVALAPGASAGFVGLLDLN